MSALGSWYDQLFARSFQSQTGLDVGHICAYADHIQSGVQGAYLLGRLHPGVYFGSLILFAIRGLVLYRAGQSGNSIFARAAENQSR